MYAFFIQLHSVEYKLNKPLNDNKYLTIFLLHKIGFQRLISLYGLGDEKKLAKNALFVQRKCDTNARF